MDSFKKLLGGIHDHLKKCDSEEWQYFENNLPNISERRFLTPPIKILLCGSNTIGKSLLLNSIVRRICKFENQVMDMLPLNIPSPKGQECFFTVKYGKEHAIRVYGINRLNKIKRMDIDTPDTRITEICCLVNWLMTNDVKSVYDNLSNKPDSKGDSISEIKKITEVRVELSFESLRNFEITSTPNIFHSSSPSSSSSSSQQQQQKDDDDDDDDDKIRIRKMFSSSNLILYTTKNGKLSTPESNELEHLLTLNTKNMIFEVPGRVIFLNCFFNHDIFTDFHLMDNRSPMTPSTIELIKILDEELAKDSLEPEESMMKRNVKYEDTMENIFSMKNKQILDQKYILFNKEEEEEEEENKFVELYDGFLKKLCGILNRKKKEILSQYIITNVFSETQIQLSYDDSISTIDAQQPLQQSQQLQQLQQQQQQFILNSNNRREEELGRSVNQIKKRIDDVCRCIISKLNSFIFEEPAQFYLTGTLQVINNYYLLIKKLKHETTTVTWTTSSSLDHSNKLNNNWRNKEEEEEKQKQNILSYFERKLMERVNDKPSAIQFVCFRDIIIQHNNNKKTETDDNKRHHNEQEVYKLLKLRFVDYLRQIQSQVFLKVIKKFHLVDDLLKIDVSKSSSSSSSSSSRSSSSSSLLLSSSEVVDDDVSFPVFNKGKQRSEIRGLLYLMSFSGFLSMLNNNRMIYNRMYNLQNSSFGDYVSEIRELGNYFSMLSLQQQSKPQSTTSTTSNYYSNYIQNNKNNTVQIKQTEKSKILSELFSMSRKKKENEESEEGCSSNNNNNNITTPEEEEEEGKGKKRKKLKIITFSPKTRRNIPFYDNNSSKERCSNIITKEVRERVFENLIWKSFISNKNNNSMMKTSQSDKTSSTTVLKSLEEEFVSKGRKEMNEILTFIFSRRKNVAFVQSSSSNHNNDNTAVKSKLQKKNFQIILQQELRLLNLEYEIFHRNKLNRISISSDNKNNNNNKNSTYFAIYNNFIQDDDDEPQQTDDENNSVYSLYNKRNNNNNNSQQQTEKNNTMMMCIVKKKSPFETNQSLSRRRYHWSKFSREIRVSNMSRLLQKNKSSRCSVNSRRRRDDIKIMNNTKYVEQRIIPLQCCFVQEEEEEYGKKKRRRRKKSVSVHIVQKKYKYRLDQVLFNNKTDNTGLRRRSGMLEMFSDMNSYQKIQLMIEVAECLKEMHELKIIHRNFQPNVLFVGRNSVNDKEDEKDETNGKEHNNFQHPLKKYILKIGGYGYSNLEPTEEFLVSTYFSEDEENQNECIPWYSDPLLLLDLIEQQQQKKKNIREEGFEMDIFSLGVMISLIWNYNLPDDQKQQQEEKQQQQEEEESEGEEEEIETEDEINYEESQTIGDIFENYVFSEEYMMSIGSEISKFDRDMLELIRDDETGDLRVLKRFGEGENNNGLISLKLESLGLSCVNLSREKRPNVHEVLQELKELIQFVRCTKDDDLEEDDEEEKKMFKYLDEFVF